jgi:hypothetical protein
MTQKGELPADLRAKLVGASGEPPALVDRALEYAAQGLCIFPCQHFEGTPLVDWWKLRGPPSEDQVARWWGQWPTADIGCAPTPTGHSILLFAGKSGLESLEALEAKYELDPAYDIRCRWGSRMLFFSGALPNSKRRLGAGTFTIGAGRYVFLTPSLARTPEEAEG